LEANGTAKHLFIFNVAVDLCLLMAVLSLADACMRLWRRRSESACGLDDIRDVPVRSQP
jgi:hypothetical protein